MEDALERMFAVAKAELQQQQNRSSNKRLRREDQNPAPISIRTATNQFQTSWFHHLIPHPTNFTKKFSDRGRGVVDSLMHKFLQKGDSAQKYLQGSRHLKVDSWILLDNYVQGRGLSSIINNKGSHNDSKRSEKRMSMKQLKKCESLALPKETRRYQAFLPIHEIGNTTLSNFLGQLEMPNWLRTSSILTSTVPS